MPTLTADQVVGRLSAECQPPKVRHLAWMLDLGLAPPRDSPKMITEVRSHTWPRPGRHRPHEADHAAVPGASAASQGHVLDGHLAPGNRPWAIRG